MVDEFNGFYPIRRNEVYGKENIVQYSENEVVTIREIFILKSFTEQSEENVIDYLIEKATHIQKLEKFKIPDDFKLTPKSNLESAIMNLPVQVITNIRNKEENLINFLRFTTRARKIGEYEEPKKYLSVRYGIIPKEIIEFNLDEDNFSNPRWYDQALSDERNKIKGFGEKWRLRLMFDCDNLPLKNEIDILLKHGSMSSKTLEIDRPLYSQNKIKEVIDFIYELFNEKNNILKLNDFSHEILEELAIEPIKFLYQRCAAENNVVN